MKSSNTALRLSRYGFVGVGAAAVHGSLLLVLSQALPLWVSNLFAFLMASITSYLGHSFYTFRKETKGERFARRWLVIQFISNVAISAFLPVILVNWENQQITTFTLVLTPTLINALIWTQAAKFSASKHNLKTSLPYFHADDFGLTAATNSAILDLASAGKLQGASLIVNGTAVGPAIEAWKENQGFPLTLHLCLTEGKALSRKEDIISLINPNGILNLTFLKLLFISFLPKKTLFRRNIERQLHHELSAQIHRFKGYTFTDKIALDGHQHIHLIPIVLDVILEAALSEGIEWIRTTNEPLPKSLSYNFWHRVVAKGGLIKWIILSILNLIAKPRILAASIKTNAGFGGILSTGQMSQEAINHSIKELSKVPRLKNETPHIILIHPADKLDINERDSMLKTFPISNRFVQSSWRQREWEAIKLIQQKH